MATESYSASLAEWANVIRHLCNMKRLRAEAQRLRQRPETLDALDSVIAVDPARDGALNKKRRYQCDSAASMCHKACMVGSDRLELSTYGLRVRRSWMSLDRHGCRASRNSLI